MQTLSLKLLPNFLNCKTGCLKSHLLSQAHNCSYLRGWVEHVQGHFWQEDNGADFEGSRACLNAQSADVARVYLRRPPLAIDESLVPQKIPQFQTQKPRIGAVHLREGRLNLRYEEAV